MARSSGIQVSRGGPRWGREQRIGDEVVAATMDAAAEGGHDETPFPPATAGG
jgi:hypothetical protein